MPMLVRDDLVRSGPRLSSLGPCRHVGPSGRDLRRLQTHKLGLEELHEDTELFGIDADFAKGRFLPRVGLTGIADIGFSHGHRLWSDLNRDRLTSYLA